MQERSGKARAENSLAPGMAGESTEEETTKNHQRE
jgi:hypothetical protein